jgi:ABC-type antimicrobial peptide transport system permease subunit
VALGSRPSRLVFTILWRPLMQMAMGIAVGGALTFLWADDLGLSAAFLAVTAGYLLVMIFVCLLACIAPARRAMRVDPIAALRVS